VLGIDPSSIIQVSIDLLTDGVDVVSDKVSTLELCLPTLCCWEGGSMYFSESRCVQILSSFRPLLSHQESRLWFDYVHGDVTARAATTPGAEPFLDAMQRMGEPFVNGFNDVSTALARLDLVVESDTASGAEALFELYRFCVARRKYDDEAFCDRGRMSFLA
jgi:O-methyltransferase involved in polyketide biosynthesis